MLTLTCKTCRRTLDPIHLDLLPPELGYCSLPCAERAGLPGPLLEQLRASLAARAAGD